MYHAQARHSGDNRLGLSIIILAAGQGTRMRSALPKVLQTVAGKPLLGHVLDGAQALQATDICIVYGHGGEAVRKAFQGESLRWVLQAEQLGTGHAMQQAMPGTPRRESRAGAVRRRAVAEVLDTEPAAGRHAGR